MDVVIVTISGGAIFLFFFIIGAPIYVLGTKLFELFQLISQYVLEISIGSFALCFTIALIYSLIRKDYSQFFPIFLNTPAIGIIPAFGIAETAKGFSAGGFLGGSIVGIISLLVSVICLIASIAVIFGVFMLLGSISQNKLTVIKQFFISLGGAILQFIIFAISFI